MFFYIFLYITNISTHYASKKPAYMTTEISKVLIGWSCYSRWTLLWKQSRKSN